MGKGKVKASTVDKYLRRIREQIVEIVKKNSTVIEYGCGNGDLMFKLSSKIKSGIGVDISDELIQYAKDRALTEGSKNLEFKAFNATNDSESDQMDYCITSLVLHVLSVQDSKKLIDLMVRRGETILICAFSKPMNSWQSFLLWLDQRFSGHYKHFKMYKRNGYAKGLLDSYKVISYSEIDTFDPVIKIYEINRG